MPYRDSNVGTPTWPGAGDDDAADFLVDVIQPFLTDAKVSGDTDTERMRSTL